ncbi:transmembrane protein 141-like [Branchiostoma floridae]|uniref:Transmembrane protein 141-like n=1 Tax=Branchiostoma floridae TaxID=7739 RepID=A0A9J7MYX9_BRAFL|nr:transmembrane protein 141-like [Branchiostoma floridae]
MPLTGPMDDPDVEEKYPGSRAYTVCQSGAFMSGVFATVTGGLVTFIGQSALRKRLPWGSNPAMVISIAVAAGSGWVVAYTRSRECQQKWYEIRSAHEEKMKLLAKEDSGTSTQVTEVAPKPPEQPHQSSPVLSETNKYGDPIQ